MTARASLLLGTALLALGTACKDEPTVQPVSAPTSGERLLVVSADEFQAGKASPNVFAPNPITDDATARAAGQQLFTWYNCAGCHGPEGGGAIGPPLIDADWIYGAEPANIFQSVAQGRPNGMPAFGGKIPDTDIWKLELYIRSLGGPALAGAGRAPTNPQQRRPGS